MSVTRGVICVTERTLTVIECITKSNISTFEQHNNMKNVARLVSIPTKHTSTPSKAEP